MLDFAAFGIILTATPESVPANGVDLITLTATVRMWRDFDISEPTGDPVSMAIVLFETDLGEFWGDSTGYTDMNGEATVSIVSEEAGYATVQAHTEPVVVQAEPVVVQFEGLMTLVLDGDPEDWDGSIGGDYTEYYCLHFDGSLNGGMFALDHYEPRHWHYQVEEEVGSPGDVLEFTWAPQGDCADGDPYDYPVMSAVYLHYFYGTDYENQITVQLSEGHAPLTEIVEAHVTLQDPAAGSDRSGAKSRRF